ncbi:head fiber protein [Bifidobacterium catulorum]|uniref:Head fiber protein n=1 Tax=Bifidobacterium catulorum TaxID=1630173 RepID=A0A2U2MUG8_9BIFI|nr:head fiber protein [Bifidobacterium catulorum]PWG60497.1 hypothetical protein DF200_02570 [Bifidobacterium catulorum]
MAIKIMPLPAAQADEFIAPYDGIMSAVFVDADGNPIDITGGADAAPAVGSVTPASLSGYDAGTGHSKMVRVKADGSGFDFVDDSVTPPSGSITTSMLKAGCVNTSAIADKQVTAAKLADGVIPDAYTLPAASAAAIGGVKQAAYVADPAGDAPTKAEFIALRDALVAAGIMAPKA